MTCYAGAIHYYAYVDGKNRLLDNNDCEQTAQIWVDKKNRLMFRVRYYISLFESVGFALCKLKWSIVCISVYLLHACFVYHF